MKRVIFILCCFLVTFKTFSETEVRLLANIETVLGDSVEDTFEKYENNQNNLYGFSWEVILGQIGLGMHYGVIFESFDDLESAGDKEWWLDWKGDMYLSYHLFGAKTFIDPFVEIGVGNAGRTYIGSTADDYHEDDYYEYNDHEHYDDSNVTNMSLYPYAAVGGAVNLNGFVVGAKANYIMSNNGIPGTSFDVYPLENTSLTVFTGVSF